VKTEVALTFVRQTETCMRYTTNYCIGFATIVTYNQAKLAPCVMSCHMDVADAK